MRPYPARGAYPVDPLELGLPATDLDISLNSNVNNHHLWWTARSMGRLLITQTLRDLDANQRVMPIDTHKVLHYIYGPPEMPDIHDVMDVIDEAYETHQLLRYGSALSPKYRSITSVLYRQIQEEYNQMNT